MPERIHIGDPSWDTGPWPSLSGSPDRIASELRTAVELGANVFHVRFAACTVDEEIDQITAFGRDVAPLLGAQTPDEDASAVTPERSGAVVRDHTERD